jgi:hypothetical protein
MHLLSAPFIGVNEGPEHGDTDWVV